jgi:hypothetical protein
MPPVVYQLKILIVFNEIYVEARSQVRRAI